MKKKGVEVYFVIYICALVSLLAIEAELDEYEKKQESFIFKLLENELKTMVSAEGPEAVESSGMSSAYRISFNGEYDPASFQATATMVPYRSSPKKTKHNAVPLTKVSGTVNQYDMKYKQGEYSNDTFKMVVHARFIPKISKQFQDTLKRRYNDDKVVKKILEKITLAISKKDTIPVDIVLPSTVIPDIGPGQVVLIINQRELVVPRTLSVPLEVGVTGVKDANSYDIITDPPMLVTKNGISAIITVSNIHTNELVITARSRNGKSDTKRIPVVVTNLVRERPPLTSQEIICVNDQYKLDARIIDIIPSTRISVRLSGDFYQTPVLEQAIATLSAFGRSGSFRYEILVDGSETGLAYTVQVRNAQQPMVRVNRLVKAQRLVTWFITIYCSQNSIRTVSPVRGIDVGLTGKIVPVPFGDVTGSPKVYEVTTYVDPTSIVRGNTTVEIAMVDAMGNRVTGRQALEEW